MRIVGGIATGRIIKVPKGLDVRPTPDLVKQAIFNSLGERVMEARVLELFAGSGALSLEALSRGAKSALCVEKSAKHARFISANIAEVGLETSRFEVRVQDAYTAIAQFVAGGKQFDIIVADPPYGDKNVGRRSQSFAQKLLDDPNLPLVLAPGGLLILGHTKRDTLELMSPWEEKKMLKHGDTVMRFLTKKDS